MENENAQKKTGKKIKVSRNLALKLKVRTNNVKKHCQG